MNLSPSLLKLSTSCGGIPASQGGGVFLTFQSQQSPSCILLPKAEKSQTFSGAASLFSGSFSAPAPPLPRTVGARTVDPSRGLS